MHPLFDTNIKNLKDSEIESKIAELSRKYFQATNPYLRDQITMLLDDYKNELQIRRFKQWEEQNQKRDTDLDSLINIS